LNKCAANLSCKLDSNFYHEGYESES